MAVPSVARSLVLAGRALRLRCPACGRGPVLAAWRPGQPWGAVRERCTACGFRFERSGDHYFGGAMLVNLLVAELLFAVGFVAVILLTWPNVPWDVLTYGAAAGMLLIPFVLYPVSKVFWVAVDVFLRPATPEEHDAAHGPAPVTSAPRSR